MGANATRRAAWWVSVVVVSSLVAGRAEAQSQCPPIVVSLDDVKKAMDERNRAQADLNRFKAKCAKATPADFQKRCAPRIAELEAQLAAATTKLQNLNAAYQAYLAALEACEGPLAPLTPTPPPFGLVTPAPPVQVPGGSSTTPGGTGGKPGTAPAQPGAKTATGTGGNSPAAPSNPVKPTNDPAPKPADGSKPAVPAAGTPAPQKPEAPKPPAPGTPAPKAPAAPGQPPSIPASFTPMIGLLDVDSPTWCTFGGSSLPLLAAPGGIQAATPADLRSISLTFDEVPSATSVAPPRRFSSDYRFAASTPELVDLLNKALETQSQSGIVDRMWTAGLDGPIVAERAMYWPGGTAPATSGTPTGSSTPGPSGTETPSGAPRRLNGPQLVVPSNAGGDQTSNEPPPPPVTFTLVVKAKQTVLDGGKPTNAPLGGAQLSLNLFPPPPLPGQGARDIDTGADRSPVKLTTDANGQAQDDITVGFNELFPPRVPRFATGPDGRPANTFSAPADQAIRRNVFDAGFDRPPIRPFRTEVEIDATPRGGTIVGLSSAPPSPGASSEMVEAYWQSLIRDTLFDGIEPFVNDRFMVGNTPVISLSYPSFMGDQIQAGLAQSQNILFSEVDRCVEIQTAPNDPLFKSRSTWKQPYDDQWAIKRVGFTGDAGSAWDATKDAKPVVVAVIDTGIDWNHEDIAWESLWNNADEKPGNGIDDDKNGFVDDTIGWDFWRKTNLPWDRNGHGTFVAGIIAATSGNGIGIAGINPHARIMVLKALNSFGHGRASQLSHALVYAVDNGAQVINVSVGGKGHTRTEQMAIEYAHKKGVVVVVSSGNEGTSDAFGPGGVPQVITVAATDVQDKRSVYSNWGPQLDVAAPGDDVLGPRARYTDLMQGLPGVPYKEGEAMVGETRRYYRASGTSFAAPIVTGVASLIVGRKPGITPDQVKRMIVHSARDLDVPGVDRYTGYGLLNAVAALGASPDFFVEAAIAGVAAAQKDGRTVVQVTGTADADDLKAAWIEIGPGETPTQWKKVSKTLDRPVRSGVLDEIAAETFRESKKWTLRLVTEHRKGQRREARFVLNLG